VNENEGGGTEKLWEELRKIGVEDNYLLHVYSYLHKNPADLKASYGVPIHQRKEFLARIVPNYAPQGSVQEVEVNYTSQSYFYSSYHFS